MSALVLKTIITQADRSATIVQPRFPLLIAIYAVLNIRRLVNLASSSSGAT
jgi:hypothetical protein